MMARKVLSLKKRLKKLAIVSYKKISQRISKYMSATPHRSFRLTRRRDIPLPVTLPGYLSFSREVIHVIRNQRMLLIKLVLICWVFSFFLIGLSQQDRYGQVQDVLTNAGKELFGGNEPTSLQRVGTIFVSVASGTLNMSLSESQQIYVGQLYLFVWLIVIWLLRYSLSGKNVSVRDGIYNAGAPLISIFAIVAVGLVQILPGIFGASTFMLAQSAGVLVKGIEVAAFFVAALLLIVLSLYWVVSTFFAVIIATIPGTYPLAALRSARHLVVGQRNQILFRMLWLMVLNAVIFSLIMVPTVAIDYYMKLSSYPFVTLIQQFVIICLLVFSSTYIYMLYRKIIDERAN